MAKGQNYGEDVGENREGCEALPELQKQKKITLKKFPVKAFEKNFLHERFSTTPFLILCKKFHLWCEKIKVFYSQAAARVPMLISCTLNDIYFLPFHLSPTHLLKLSLSARLIREQKAEKNQFLCINFHTNEHFFHSFAFS